MARDSGLEVVVDVGAVDTPLALGRFVFRFRDGLRDVSVEVVAGQGIDDPVTPDWEVFLANAAQVC